jgi:hypothetical protein
MSILACFLPTETKNLHCLYYKMNVFLLQVAYLINFLLFCPLHSAMKDELQLWLLLIFTVTFPVIIILFVMLVRKLWHLLYGDRRMWNTCKRISYKCSPFNIFILKLISCIVIKVFTLVSEFHFMASWWKVLPHENSKKLKFCNLCLCNFGTKYWNL